MTSFSASHALAGAVQSARFSSQARPCGGSRPTIRYTLPAGQAMTVQARGCGVLRVGQGRIWVTFSHADRDRRVPAGDHFLERGESLRLSAGQAVVMEAWREAMQGAATPACVSWEADAPARLLGGLMAAGWRAATLRPLTGLRHALGLAA